MFPNLDTITRSVLMQKGYPLHWYVQFLKYAADGLRELKFDSLPSFQTRMFNISPTGVVFMPESTVDVISVDHMHGQFTRPLVQQININPLPNQDAQGNSVLYPNNDHGFIGEYNRYAERWNGTNEGYIYLPTSKTIQLTQGLRDKRVLVKFIDDGSCTDNATEVHPYAQATLEQYTKWQYKENTRTYSGGERQMEENKYYNQLRLLKDRIDPLTCEDVINIVNRASNRFR